MYATLEELHKVPSIKVGNNIDWQISDNLTDQSLNIKHMAMEMIMVSLMGVESYFQPPKFLTTQEFYQREKTTEPKRYARYLKNYNRDRNKEKKNYEMFLDWIKPSDYSEIFSFNWCIQVSGLTMRDFNYFLNGLRNGKTFSQCRMENRYD